MAKKLRLCPFCGSEAKIVSGYNKACVVCSSCCNSTRLCKTKEDAIKLWNMRKDKNEKEAVINNNSEPYLELCPFCDGKAEFKTVFSKFKSYKLYYVECKDCNAYTVIRNTDEDAARIWNRRTKEK